VKIAQGFDLAKVYRRGSTETAALRGVTFEVEKGEIVFVLGPSGSGKSTLLQLLGALDTPTSGRVVLFGEDVAAKSDRDRSLLRRKKLGFVFQSFHLIPALSAVENVLVPRVPRGSRTATGSAPAGSSSASASERASSIVRTSSRRREPARRDRARARRGARARPRRRADGRARRSDRRRRRGRAP